MLSQERKRELGSKLLPDAGKVAFWRLNRGQTGTIENTRAGLARI
jgi:hypothetical protein